jgi:hypothetical protein
MNRLRVTRGMSVVCGPSGKLAAVAAALAILGGVAAVPAAAERGVGGGRQDAGEHRFGAGELQSSASVVNFQSSPPGIFSCTQGVTGPVVLTGDTASITFTATTVTARVTLHAPAGTFFSGQLTQGPFCSPTENFQGTVPHGASSVTVTVTDGRGFGATGAFVSVTKGGSFEITPLVKVPSAGFADVNASAGDDAALAGDNGSGGGDSGAVGDEAGAVWR